MVITSLLPWNWKKYTSAPWNNRQSAFNAIEKAYRKANSISRIAMSLDDWVMVAEAFLAIAIPDITGWPERLTIPIIFFVLQCGWLSIRRQDQWFQKILWTALVCFLFYLGLTYVDRIHRWAHRG